MKKVIIVGAGFGGLSAAKNLAESELDITIVDRRNHHLFQPLLYQVATAALTSADIATPIRSVFSKYPNVKVLMGEVTHIDTSEKKVYTDFGLLTYDYLILACGSEHSYFSNPNWEEVAPGLKTLEQAIEIRRRILTAFEKAEKEVDAQEKSELLTFVIVGGGPTGVELAGAIAEIARKTLLTDFRNINPAGTRVILIESGPRILSAFNERLSSIATQHLENLGVEVLTGAKVEEVTGKGVKAGPALIKARTVIWAAGVKPSALVKTLMTQTDRIGRILVNGDLSLPTDRSVFVIGDMAHILGKDQKPLPGLAPVAMQEGVHAAKMIFGDLEGKNRKPFEYFDKGQMATIGTKKAIVEIGRVSFNGFFAWLVWTVIHIYYLIGFRNKFFVIMQWAWSYLTFKRGARLIVASEWRLRNRSDVSNATAKRVQ